MAKFQLLEVEGHLGVKLAMFFCQGCQNYHAPNVGATDDAYPTSWAFNGDAEKPTIAPSLLTGSDNFTKRRCHSFVTNGQIRYLSDCHHALAGQTLDLLEWDDPAKDAPFHEEKVVSLD